ncbi:MAG: hypothetical protein NXI32_28755 [bacterium]|nr:hypothetical protein [bacterium]
MPNFLKLLGLATWLTFTAAWPAASARGQTAGTVEIDVLDQTSEEPLTCRVRILDARGRPQRARGAILESGWNLLESPMVFRGRPGDYRYQVSRGPEYAAGHGEFTLDKGSLGNDVLRLPRHADLSAEGWVGGDLGCQLAPAQASRWLEAEGLAMTACLTESLAAHSNNPLLGGAQWVEDDSYWDQREGSGLVFHHWMPPAEVPPSVPSSRLLIMAKETPDTSASATGEMEAADALPVHIEIQKLWARDLPMWLASDRVDSIQLLGMHLRPEEEPAPTIRPLIEPDPGRFRGPRAAGQMVEALYWRVLESGLRIPPTAGSGFGKAPTHLGYNRVYAAVASDTRADWWRAVRQGRSFVSSGPLLRVLINEQPPGAIFAADVGQSVALDVALTLTVSDPVDYLDVIFNGRTLYQARLDEYAKQGGRIPRLSVDESGWLVVRVVTGIEDTYRIASTAPFYVEIDGQPRISRAACEFFQSWLEAAAEQIAGSQQAESALPFVQAARKFWERRLSAANAP